MSSRSRRFLPVTWLAVSALTITVLVALPWMQTQGTRRLRMLFAAIRRNDAAEVTVLLNAGVAPNAREPETTQGFLMTGSLSAMFNHENRHENRQTPLLAALYGIRFPKPNTTEISANPQPDPTIVRALLDKGARVDVVDDTANTAPLTFAVLSGNIEIVRMLVQHGAQVKSAKKNRTHTGATWRDGEKDPPLICAAGQNRTDMMRLLLALGADVNAYDPAGATALIDTVRYARNPDAVRLLLEHHADVNHKDWRGSTALTYARAPFRNLAPAQIQSLPQVIALLKHAGAK